MSLPSETDHLDFWQSQAVESLSLRLAESRPGTAAPEITEEIDELLWALAEGELPESAQDRVEQLVSQIPQVMQRLGEIHRAIEETADAQPSDPAKLWARLSRQQQPVVSVPTIAIFDLVLRFVEDGFELLTTTGRAAYAPALARSAATSPKTTAAIEFLTSIGTVQIVVDRIGDDRCNLTARPTRLTGRLRAEEISLEIRAVSGVHVCRVPFEDGRARVLDLTGGTYRLVFVKDEKDLAFITLDLQHDA